MRNILVTIMMIVVVVVMFVTIINSEDGLKGEIEDQGKQAVQEIKNAIGTDS